MPEQCNECVWLVYTICRLNVRFNDRIVVVYGDALLEIGNKNSCWRNDATLWLFAWRSVTSFWEVMSDILMLNRSPFRLEMTQ